MPVFPAPVPVPDSTGLVTGKPIGKCKEGTDAPPPRPVLKLILLLTTGENNGGNGFSVCAEPGVADADADSEGEDAGVDRRVVTADKVGGVSVPPLRVRENP